MFTSTNTLEQEPDVIFEIFLKSMRKVKAIVSVTLFMIFRVRLLELRFLAVALL